MLTLKMLPNPFMVKAMPKASKNTIKVDEQGNIKVYVTDAPENGKANKAIINLIAKELKIAKSQLKLIRGETAKEKWFELDL